MRSGLRQTCRGRCASDGQRGRVTKIDHDFIVPRTCRLNEDRLDPRDFVRGASIPFDRTWGGALIRDIHGIRRPLANSDGQSRSALHQGTTGSGQTSESRKNNGGAAWEGHLPRQEQAALQRIQVRSELPRGGGRLTGWLVAHGNSPQSRRSRQCRLTRRYAAPRARPHLTRPRGR